jgi:hypothetical protein
VTLWKYGALVLLSSGCALDEGRGFATLEQASLEAEFGPEAARSLDDRVLTNQGFTVAVERFTLELGSLELSSLSGGTTATFDPAHPPPGYTLCHGGHCHKDDGSLVSYADVAAELAGGFESFVPVVSFEIGRDVDLLAGRTVALEPTPSAELPMTHLTRATLHVLGANLTFGVEDGTLADEVTWAEELEPDLTLAQVLDVVIDRESEPRLSLDARVTCGARLFDDIDFANAALDDASIALHQALTENLSALEFEVSLQ